MDNTNNGQGGSSDPNAPVAVNPMGDTSTDVNSTPMGEGAMSGGVASGDQGLGSVPGVDAVAGESTGGVADQAPMSSPDPVAAPVGEVGGTDATTTQAWDANANAAAPAGAGDPLATPAASEGTDNSGGDQNPGV